MLWHSPCVLAATSEHQSNYDARSADSVCYSKRNAVLPADKMQASHGSNRSGCGCRTRWHCVQQASRFGGRPGDRNPGAGSRPRVRQAKSAAHGALADAVPVEGVQPKTGTVKQSRPSEAA